MTITGNDGKLRKSEAGFVDINLAEIIINVLHYQAVVILVDQNFADKVPLDELGLVEFHDHFLWHATSRGGLSLKSPLP